MRKCNTCFEISILNYFVVILSTWYEEEERKKDPTYKKEIAPQFEYNQFIRDFFTDPKNQGKRNEIKKLPGSNKYKSSN